MWQWELDGGKERRLIGWFVCWFNCVHVQQQRVSQPNSLVSHWLGTRLYPDHKGTPLANTSQLITGLNTT